MQCHALTGGSWEELMQVSGWDAYGGGCELGRC